MNHSGTPVRERHYWFRAKRYGWGCGPPASWQGWVVTVVWFGTVIIGAVRLLPTRPISFALFTLFMGGVLTMVCLVTAEPPRRRDGE
jgi:hypothetical protein